MNAEAVKDANSENVVNITATSDSPATNSTKGKLLSTYF